MFIKFILYNFKVVLMELIWAEKIKQTNLKTNISHIIKQKLFVYKTRVNNVQFCRNNQDLFHVEICKDFDRQPE